MGVLEVLFDNEWKASYRINVFLYKESVTIKNKKMKYIPPNNWIKI